MIADELSAIKTYVEELEALREYPQVKKERDRLWIEAGVFEVRAAYLEAQLAEEKARHAECDDELREVEGRAQSTENKLTDAEQQLSALRDFKVKVPDGDFSLDELRREFLHNQASVVEALVNERVEKLKQEMRARMPDLVEEEFKQALSAPNRPPEIAKIVQSEAARLADETLHDNERWPQWFKNSFAARLKMALASQLDAEFRHRVAVEAKKSLDEMKARAWEQYVATRARELAISLKTLVSQLQGTQLFNCDRCQQQFSLEIGQAEIVQLLAGRIVDLKCSFCLDPAPPPFIFSTVPHKVASIAFSDLLQWYLGENPPTN